MKKAVIVRGKCPSKTILDAYFDELGESLDSFDVDFIVSLRKLGGIRSSKSFPVESGHRYEYKVFIDEDLGCEINDLKNQIAFEKLGLWIVYDFCNEILRVTTLN